MKNKHKWLWTKRTAMFVQIFEERPNEKSKIKDYLWPETFNHVVDKPMKEGECKRFRIVVEGKKNK